MDGQNTQQQKHAVSGAKCAAESAPTTSHKSRQMIGGGVFVRTISGRSNISGCEQIGSEPIRVSEQGRGSLPNIQKIQKRIDDHSSRSQPLAFNRTPNIDADSTNNNAYVNQVVFDNFNTSHGTQGSETSRQGGSGRITPVAPASRTASHSRIAAGIATPSSSRNTTPRVRPLKQPGYRAGDPIICVRCMDSQGIGSSCPKCGKHNNEKARRYVPGELPDVCLPINDEIAVGSVPGSARSGSAPGRFNPESSIQAEETPREFQYTADHGASVNQPVASLRAQIAAKIRGRLGNLALNSLNSGRNAALLTSEQNTESKIQRSASTDMEGSNLKGSIPVESIFMQQPNSSREVTPRTDCSGNGMHPTESSSGTDAFVRSGSDYSGSPHIGSGTKASATATMMGLLFAGGSSILSSKLRKRRTVVAEGTGPPDAGASGKQQGMQPVAPSMPSGRHSTGGNFANAYANTSGGGYPSVNSARSSGSANGGYPNGIYRNGSHSVSVGDEGADGESNRNIVSRAFENAQAICYEESEDRVISTLQNMSTQNMDGQNASLTAYSYEQVASNPGFYHNHSWSNRMDAQAGSVQRMQSGMQGMEGYPAMSESGIGSQTGSQNVGSQTGGQNIRGSCKSERHLTLGCATSEKISAQTLFSTLKGSFRRDKKSVESANLMNADPVSGQEESSEEQQFQNQVESTTAPRSPSRSLVGSRQQKFPASVLMMNQARAGPSAMSTNASSTSLGVVTHGCTLIVHTPLTHTPSTPRTSMHMPTANNMYYEQQKAQQQSVADRVAQQQLKMKAKRELEVAQAKAANMAVIRASQKSNGGTSSRQKRIGTLPRQEIAGTSPREGGDGEFRNRDEMIVAPRGEERISSKGCKSKEENKKRSSQRKEQEQNAFKEQEWEAGFQLSKQDGINKQDGSTQTSSRSPPELSIKAVSDQQAPSTETNSNFGFKKVSSDSADNGFAQGDPEDGGWANVPAGGNENDVAVVKGNNMNFGDGMDNGLNFNGILGMSITVPSMRNGVPSQKRNSKKDVKHTGVTGSPSGNNTQSNKECEDYCNSLLGSVHLNKVSGLVNNSEATSNSNKALNPADAVNNVRNIVSVNNLNVNIAQLYKVPSTSSSIQGESLVEVNRALDELEKAKEQEVRVYSKVQSMLDGIDFHRRQLSVNDPLAHMIDDSDNASSYDRADADSACDGAASYYAGLESGGPGISHPSQPGGASGGSQSASGPQSPHSSSHDPNHGRNGRNVENNREMGYWSDGSGDGMGKCNLKEENLF